MKKITIVAIDDHKFIREMWQLLFYGNSEIELIGQGSTLKEGIEIVNLKKPEIVLLDINLKNDSGIDAVPLIKKYSPGTKIIAVSMHTEPAYAKKMLQLGAKGYITKNSSHKEVFDAIHILMNGGIYVCSEIKDFIIDQAIQIENGVPDIRKLSFREIEIIKLIKDGLSSKEIASRLNIATRTIDVHRHNILRKLNMSNVTTLINFINTTDLTFN